MFAFTNNSALNRCWIMGREIPVIRWGYARQNPFIICPTWLPVRIFNKGPKCITCCLFCRWLGFADGGQATICCHSRVAYQYELVLRVPACYYSHLLMIRLFRSVRILACLLQLLQLVHSPDLPQHRWLALPSQQGQQTLPTSLVW